MTERESILLLFDAYRSLRALGWQDAIYCPKDGTVFEVIEVGSIGIHDCHYEGKWPDGTWWVHNNNDLYPSRPSLFRLKKKEKKP